MSQFVFEPHSLHGETIDGEAMPFGYISQIQESGHRLPVFELNTVFGDMPGLDLAGIARAMAAAPAMAAMLRGIDRDDDGDAMLDASGMDEIAAILSCIDGAGDTLPDAPVPHDLEPAQNGPDGHCLHCGRDNTGHEGEPCADDCPQYWEAKGRAHPEHPTGDESDALKAARGYASNPEQWNPPSPEQMAEILAMIDRRPVADAPFRHLPTCPAIDEGPCNCSDDDDNPTA